MSHSELVAKPSTLSTAGGACTVFAVNHPAWGILSSLTATMQLDSRYPSDMLPGQKSYSRLLIYVDKDFENPDPAGIGHTFESGSTTICRMGQAADMDSLALQMMWLSPFLVREMELSGGFLLHGALAEHKGYGIVFAGPGGRGKTTTSLRLPPPWKSLSDDTTLVVRDESGVYWAHPWPTWSRFMWGGPGGAWDVNHSVPLKGIFLLVQAEDACIKPIGTGQAIVMLQEVSEQASFLSLKSLDDERARARRLQRFENICTLAKKVPTSILQTSLASHFWEQIEREAFDP